MDRGVADGLRVAALQRAEGSLRLAWAAEEGATRLAELGQAGCLRACFPRAEPEDFTGAVVVNVSGGVAGGDRLAMTARIGAGARALITTQAAERVYRAKDFEDPALLSTQIEVGAGGCVEYLPQETILFDGGSFERSLEVKLAEEARFIGVEWVIFGRTARGEQVRRGHVRDRVAIYRGARLVWRDAVRLTGNLAAQLARPAVARGAVGVASLIYAGPDAGRRIDALRGALAPFEAGASCWDDLLVARILGQDGMELRRAVLAGLGVLRDGRGVPRVWN